MDEKENWLRKKWGIILQTYKNQLGIDNPANKIVNYEETMFPDVMGAKK